VLFFLLIFIFVPIATYKIAKSGKYNYIYSLTGISIGVIIYPLSFGLYSLFFIPYIGFAPGILGLILTMIHSTPGFYLATSLELIPIGLTTEVTQHIVIAIFNGIVWSIFYGFIGFLIDFFRIKNNK